VGPSPPGGGGASSAWVAPSAENPCIAARVGLKLRRGWGAVRHAPGVGGRRLRTNPLNLAGLARWSNRTLARQSAPVVAVACYALAPCPTPLPSRRAR